MYKRSAQGEFALVSDLEAICSEISNHLSPFKDLKDRAEKIKLSVSDCFMRLIYYTSCFSGSKRMNLHTRLLNSAHKHRTPLMVLDGGASHFIALKVEIQNAYLSLDQFNKAFYLNRLEKLANQCQSLQQIFRDLKEHTSELKRKIEEKGHKVTPERVRFNAEQHGFQTSGYNECIPQTLEVVKAVIWFFDPYLLYFTQASVELNLFALEVVQATKEIASESNQKRKGLVKIEEQTFDSFSDMLLDATELPVLLQKLRGANKRHPVIDDNNKFMKRHGSISIVVAWVDVLAQRSKFKKSVSDKQMATLLNQLFPGLELNCNDPSILRKSTDKRNKYHADFLILIPK